jgi:phosphatidylserine/phosphatidylglycerophosphate/cardiolipin synthase-like enzyme
MLRSLIVLPDDSAQPILDAIAAAKKTLRVKMFVVSDPAMLQAVIAANGRGVNVRIMLNRARRSGEDDNAESREQLANAGVDVIDGNPAFDLTHEKSMVVDDERAFVKSLNWDTKNLTETRDYAIATKHAREVEEIVACFEADWNRTRFAPGPRSHLIWCSDNGRERIAEFIDRAKHTLFLQNERYQDPIVIEHLVRARGRGVRIHAMVRSPHTLKKYKLLEGVGGLRIMDDAGIQIRTMKRLKLHGKLLLADDARAIVGSINLAPGSFDSRRELAIEVHDGHIVERLAKVVRHDWEQSHPLDLSDEALIAALILKRGH